MTWETIVFIFLGVCLIVSFIVLAITQKLKKLWIYIVSLIPVIVAGIAALGSLKSSKGEKANEKINNPVTSESLQSDTGGNKQGYSGSNSGIIEELKRRDRVRKSKKPY